MNWNELFSTKRLDEKNTDSASETRSSFEVDFDRVVFSSAFRRLQDKTQVIPLPESDFVHTRLTHSLETSCVGRSLAKKIGSVVVERKRLKNITVEDFGSVVATACLAHDIGNPPFGHSGESAISNYFRKGAGRRFEKEIPAEQWSDLINFEGNANGFRILTNRHNILKGNIRLTYSTLATFTKYPNASFKEGKEHQKKIHKKYGYFDADKDSFGEVFNSLNIAKNKDGIFARHPLAYLVEAADDICYRIIDFEDGIRIGLIPFEHGRDTLRSLLTNTYFKQKKFDNIKDRKEQIGYLRSKVITSLVEEVSEVFLQNEENILKGNFDKALLDEIDKKRLSILGEIEKLSVDKIYNSREVVMIEVSGFHVVEKLLDLFIDAVNGYHELGDKIRKEDVLSYKLIELLPKQFLGNDGYPEKDLYLRILQICEFIAGMTDSYAISLYRKLT